MRHPEVKYFKLLKQASDSVAYETMRKKTEQLETRYEFEKKEALLKAAQEKKDALNKSIVQKKELQIFSALLLILFLEELRRDINHSSELVNNLLVWASSQFTGSSVLPVIFSAHQLITDVLQIFIKQAAVKGISLKHELTAEEISVWADMNMIPVIIRNLVSNSTTNAVVTISIADSGPNGFYFWYGT